MKIHQIYSKTDYNTGFNLITDINYWKNESDNGEYIKQHDFYKKQLDKLKTIKLRKQRKFINHDYISLGILPILVLSKKAKIIFEDKIKGFWYPTNQKDYYVFLSHNLIDAVDLENSNIIYPESNEQEKYPDFGLYIDNLTFKDDKLKNEYIFTSPQFITKLLVTPKFEKLIKQFELTGFDCDKIFYFGIATYTSRIIGIFKLQSFRRKLCLYNEKNNTNLHLGEYKKIWVQYMDDESLLYVDWV